MKFDPSPLKALAPDWRTLVSGVLVWLSFPPVGLPLGWIALVPWLLALERAASLKRAVIQGIWMSFAFTFAIQYWVPLALHDSGNVPWSICLPGCLIYWIIGHPEFYLFAPLQRVLRAKATSPLTRVVLGAATFAALDWVVPKLYNEGIGHSTYDMVALRQVAELGGVPLLTFILALAQQTALELVLAFKKPKRVFPWPAMPWRPVVLTAFVITTALGYGAFRLTQLKLATLATQEDPARILRATVIQGNIDNELRTAADYDEEGALSRILDKYSELTEKAIQSAPRQPDLIIWPESAYPSRFQAAENEEGRLNDLALIKLVNELGVPLLFGAPAFDGHLQYNAMFLVGPQYKPATAGSFQLHRKSLLVPFGEYIPGIETFPFLKSVFSQIISLGAGPGASLIRVRGLLLAPAICYEILFPSHAIAGARKGGQLILNLTNDSWFGDTSAPHVHLVLSAFRSIETRLPQIRATNTGVSALILPTGEITQRTATFKQAIVPLEVPILDLPPTLLVRWGEWFGPTLLVAALGGFAALFITSRRARS